MLKLAIVFSVIALIAGVLGFAGIAGPFAVVAKVAFVVFLVLSLLLCFGLGVRKARLPALLAVAEPTQASQAGTRH